MTKNRKLKASLEAYVALLDAAKLAVSNFKRSRESGNFLDDDDFETWSALSRAIAKAEGKE